VVVLVAAATDAAAHHSASHWGPLYVERYLVCTHDVEQVHCVGPIRANKKLLAALKGADLDAAHRAAVDAVYFNVREAIPALRVCQKRLTARDRAQHSMLDKQASRRGRVRALHLGDRVSSETIAALVA
jgi:hypothetical protein